MALQTSGAISLNDIHVEAGGSSGTNCTINDSDIRGLISKGSGATMSFNEWYGAYAAQEFTITEGSYSNYYGYLDRTGGSIQFGSINPLVYVDTDGANRTCEGLLVQRGTLFFYLRDYTRTAGWTKIIILDGNGTTTYEFLRTSGNLVTYSGNNYNRWTWTSLPAGLVAQINGSGTTTFQIV